MLFAGVSKDITRALSWRVANVNRNRISDISCVDLQFDGHNAS